MMGEAKKYDVIIVGGGPAGMTAALWCDELGLRSCLLEKSEDLGGQLSWIHNPIRNYPGAEFSNGAECLREFKSSLAGRKFDPYPETEVVSINAGSREVVTSAGVFAGEAVIFAAGIRRRELGVPGEAEFRGRGILDSGSRDRRLAEGREVAVIGGGDAALENALILAEFANKVYLIHRRDRFSAREEFVEAVASNGKIETLFRSRAERFGGDAELEFIDIQGHEGSRRLPVSKAVVRIGVAPNSGTLAGQVDLDEQGYVKIDHLGRTSAGGVYAIGDVANPISPTIATAAGSAAVAVKTIAKFRRHLE